MRKNTNNGNITIIFLIELTDVICTHYFFFKKLYIYLFFERDRQRARRRGAEREEVRESQAGSVLSMDPDTGFNLATVRSRPESKASVQSLN